ETLTVFVKAELEKEQLDHAFFFLPLKETEILNYFESLDFQVERYALYMERSTQNIKPYIFPQNMHLKNFTIGKNEQTWLELRNKAFANLTGNDTPLSEEELTKFINSNDYIDGGMKILYDEDQPVGIICLSETEDEEAGNRMGEIGPIAVKERYRHQKLGRNLLRAGLAIAKEKGYANVGLSVDTQNINAKTLYTDEGFQEMLSFVCLRIK
ncbi:MAG: GNAT family N-acetyltransferase, partial [Thermotogota bacterium]